MQPRPRLSMEQALAKAHRRRSLWHTFYLAAPSVADFWETIAETERAIRRILISEFGRP